MFVYLIKKNGFLLIPQNAPSFASLQNRQIIFWPFFPKSNLPVLQAIFRGLLLISRARLQSSKSFAANMAARVTWILQIKPKLCAFSRYFSGLFQSSIYALFRALLCIYFCESCPMHDRRKDRYEKSAEAGTYGAIKA